MSTVSKSSPVVVRPSSEPTIKNGTSSIKLSHLDTENFPFVVLLAFEHPIKDAANTIKTALSKALVHYYPFCGRVVGSSIECTGEGAVQFIAASADCSLKEAAKLFARSSSSSSSSLLDELAVFYPVGSYGPDDPLLSVQVTEFSCGGFVLGVTWSHAVADGVGIAQFLTAVGEFARGLPSSPSVIPVRWDEAVSSHPPLKNPWKEAVMKSLQQQHPDSRFDDPSSAKGTKVLAEPLRLVSLDVTIPWSFIGRVKAELPSCTVFEAVLAVIWRCRTRAAAAAAGRLSFLGYAVNVRRHVGAKEGYYGNCAVDTLVVAASGAVASMEVVDLVKLIKQTKEQVPGQLNGDFGGRDEQLMKGLDLDDDGRYDMLLVSCWRSIGFEEADLGSGPPARVTFHQHQKGAPPPLPTCVLTSLRSSEDDGVRVLTICVKEEHADAFLGEVAKFT